MIERGNKMEIKNHKLIGHYAMDIRHDTHFIIESVHQMNDGLGGSYITLLLKEEGTRSHDQWNIEADSDFIPILKSVENTKKYLKIF